LFPRFVNCCFTFLFISSPDLQCDSAWALTKIASGTSDQTNAVVSAGAVAGLIILLGSPHPVVAEQAVWALDNIAGDGAKLRDFVIEQGVIEPLLPLIKPASLVSLAVIFIESCEHCVIFLFGVILRQLSGNAELGPWQTCVVTTILIVFLQFGSFCPLWLNLFAITTKRSSPKLAWLCPTSLTVLTSEFRKSWMLE
jgi:hypothetical protein